MTTCSLINSLHFVLISVLALFLFCFIPSLQGSECAPDWHHWSASRKCYKLYPEQVDWSRAEVQCVYQGAHHISVGDHHENQFLAELAKTQPNGQVWLGAFRPGTPNYMWSDLSPFGYFLRWRGNGPPPYNSLGCAKLDGKTGDWVQSCCRKPAATICQKPAARGGFRQR